MRFALAEEGREFARTLHELLAAADVPAATRRWADGEHDPGREVWRRLAEVGVTALAVPQPWGGVAAHPADIVVAFEELGHHAVPGPALESVVAAPILLAESGSDPLAGRWLPDLASGATAASVALPPRAPYALDADVASLVLTVDGSTLWAAEAAGGPLRSVDPARRLFAIRRTEALARGEAVPRAASRAFDAAALACAGQLLGAGRSLLAAAVAHAGTRTQFGRPIGSFQAVKHQLADAHVALELARPLAYGAAIALADRSATASRDVSAAKVACGDAAYRAARTALQVHGAVGYTREAEVSRWLTTVRALISAWGGPAAHRGRVLAALTDGGRGDGGRSGRADRGAARAAGHRTRPAGPPVG